jgi:hypothetical protein
MNMPAEITHENPFGSMQTSQPTSLVQVEQDRAVAEVQSAMVIAKKFPRNQLEAMDRILQACTRVTLAESALYAYPRGGQVVTGPSIRMAEALAQNWGNMQFGIRELSQSDGESTVEAFAWDVQTNTRQVKVFQVPHKRYTRRGVTALTDPRDIYEMVANQGARRLRACILGVIPGDVIDAAVKQCETTLANQGGAPQDQIKNLLSAFSQLGVTKEMITQRLGHRLDSVISAEILQLRKIYTSIKDGMAKATDFFELAEAPAPTNEKTDQLNKKIKAAGHPDDSSAEDQKD